MPSFANPDGSFFAAYNGVPRVVASTTGTTVTMTSAERLLYINNAGTIATLKILLPKKVEPGDSVEIGFAAVVTALTLHDGFDGAIATAPTAGAIGAAIVMRYISSALGWVKWK